MDEIEVINILKRYSDKKRDRVIKLAALLFAAIWSHLAHSCLVHMCIYSCVYLYILLFHYNDGNIWLFQKILFSCLSHSSWLLYASQYVYLEINKCIEENCPRG